MKAKDFPQVLNYALMYKENEIWFRFHILSKEVIQDPRAFIRSFPFHIARAEFLGGGKDLDAPWNGYIYAYNIRGIRMHKSTRNLSPEEFVNIGIKPGNLYITFQEASVKDNKLYPGLTVVELVSDKY